MQSKIFVAQHLLMPDMSTETFQFTQVGARLQKTYFLPKTDDEFLDNISNKNSTWSELTLQYHIWKHETKNYDNVGISHYRRFFNPYGIESLIGDRVQYGFEYGKESRPQIDFSKAVFNKLISKETTNLLDRFVTDKSTLVTLQPFVKTNQWSLWTMAENNWIPVRTIIEFFEWCKLTMEPHVFQEFDYLINQSNEHYCNNMIYCSSELFNRYSEWLFTLLFGFEKHLQSLEKQLGKQLIVPRMFGYFSEYMLRPWCIINFIDVNHVDSLCFTNLKTDTRI